MDGADVRPALTDWFQPAKPRKFTQGSVGVFRACIRKKNNMLQAGLFEPWRPFQACSHDASIRRACKRHGPLEPPARLRGPKTHTKGMLNASCDAATAYLTWLSVTCCSTQRLAVHSDHHSAALRRAEEALAIASVHELDGLAAPRTLSSWPDTLDSGWTVVFLTSQHMVLCVIFRSDVHKLVP